MELILIRHAQPVAEATEDGRPADPPLSDLGRRQADALARWLVARPLHRIVSSPARRAVLTAEATASRSGLPVEIDARLRDVDSEKSRYVPLEDERARDPDAYRARIRDYRENAEWSAISTRVEESLSDWIRRHPGQRVAVFCHGSVVNVFAAHMLGLADSVFLDVDYAGANRFTISRDGVRSVKSLNETGYLFA